MSFTTSAETQKTHKGIVFDTPWTVEDSLPVTTGNYFLTKDLTLSSGQFIDASRQNIKLFLNGHSISSVYDAHYTLSSSNKYTRYEIYGSGTEHISGTGSNNFAYMSGSEGDTLALDGVMVYDFRRVASLNGGKPGLELTDSSITGADVAVDAGNGSVIRISRSSITGSGTTDIKQTKKTGYNISTIFEISGDCQIDKITLVDGASITFTGDGRLTEATSVIPSGSSVPSGSSSVVFTSNGGSSTFTSGSSDYKVTKNGSGEWEFSVNTDIASVTDGGATIIYSTFADALSAWTDGTTLTLLNEVTTANTINVSGTRTLDLNGHGIIRTGNGSVISVASGADLTISDSNPTLEHTYSIASPAANGAGLATVGSGSLSFTGGYITGGHNTSGSSKGGGGIAVAGDLTMNGGTVIGNYVNGAGGGICHYGNGTMVLNGTNIIGNYSGNCSGGVDFNGGDEGNTPTATLNDCVIQYNYANSNVGAVGARSGTVTLNNCAIIDNASGNNSYCSGLACQDCHVTLDGGNIENNYCASSSSLLSQGLSLRNNNYANQSFTLKGSVTLSGNMLGTTAHDFIYVDRGRTINISGELTGAPIAIKMAVPGVFTSSSNTGFNDVTSFTSGVEGYQVLKNADGQLELAIHNHIWSYVSGTGENANTITAKCISEFDCPDNYKDPGLILTIIAPEKTAYNDGKTAAATLDGLSDFNTATGLTLTEDSILYSGSLSDGTAYAESTAAPTSAGTYTASVTVEGATAYVEYTISKITPQVTAPAGLTADYGQTLAEVTLPDGWEWINTTQSVGDVGTNPFQANYTPEDTVNYNEIKGVDVTVTVNPIEPEYSEPAAIAPTYNGSEQALVTSGYASGGTILYSTDDTNYSEAVPTGINAGSYTVYWYVDGDSNHTNTAKQQISVTISPADPNSTAPAAIEGLVYTGYSQELVMAGATNGGTMVYSVNGGDFAPGIPTATNAGNYEVTYMVDSSDDDNFNDTEPVTLNVSIAKAVKDAPDLTSENETAAGLGNGQIHGLEEGMEISTDGSEYTELTDISGEGYAVGTYYIRYAENENYLESPAAKVVIYVGPQVVITFDTDGGTEIAPIRGNYNSPVTAPADPVKDNARFDGWDKEIPKNMPAENIVIAAYWTELTEIPADYPDCQKDGNIRYFVDDEGNMYFDNHGLEPASEYEVKLSVTGHIGGGIVQENVVPAEPGVNGSYDEVEYCSVCGEEISRIGCTIPALDPIPESEPDNSYTPTPDETTGTTNDSTSPAESTDSTDDTKAGSEEETKGNDTKENDPKGNDTKENDPKGNDSKDEDSKGNDSKDDDSKGNDSKEDDPKENDPKKNDSKDDDSKGNDTKENDSKDEDSKGNDSKEDDSKGNDSKDDDSKGNDTKENDSKENDPKDEDSKGNDSKEDDSKENDPKKNDSKENDSKDEDTKGNDTKDEDTKENDPKTEDSEVNDPKDEDTGEKDASDDSEQAEDNESDNNEIDSDINDPDRKADTGSDNSDGTNSSDTASSSDDRTVDKASDSGSTDNRAASANDKDNSDTDGPNDAAEKNAESSAENEGTSETAELLSVFEGAETLEEVRTIAEKEAEAMIHDCDGVEIHMIIDRFCEEVEGGSVQTIEEAEDMFIDMVSEVRTQKKIQAGKASIQSEWSVFEKNLNYTSESMDSLNEKYTELLGKLEQCTSEAEAEKLIEEWNNSKTLLRVLRLENKGDPYILITNKNGIQDGSTVSVRSYELSEDERNMIADYLSQNELELLTSLGIDFQIYEEGSEYTVTIQLPADAPAGGKYTVTCIGEDGSVKYVDAKYNADGTITFMTNRFSKIVIAGKKGISLWYGVAAFLFVTIISALLLIFGKRNKERG